MRPKHKDTPHVERFNFARFRMDIVRRGKQVSLLLKDHVTSLYSLVGQIGDIISLDLILNLQALENSLNSLH